MTTKTTKPVAKSSKPSIKNATKPVAKKVEPTKAAPKQKTERKPSMSSVARALILAGKTNAEVFTALHKQFSLSEQHKAYASWFRAQLVRLEKKVNGQKAAEHLHAKLAKTA